MLAQETIHRRVEELAKLTITRDIWSWLNKKFEGVDGRLQKANLRESAIALLLLAQLISIIQKELPESSEIKDILNHYDQDGYQTNLVVRRQNPWKAIHENHTGPLGETQHGFFTISLLAGPKPQPDKDPQLALVEMYIPYSGVLEGRDGQFKNTGLTAAMVTNSDRKDINRPATKDELRLVVGIVKNAALEKI